MTQMQSFDFLSSIKTLDLPKSKSVQEDFFSDEDATAWAKEAEAAGIPAEEELNELDSRGSTTEEEDSKIAALSTGAHSESEEMVPEDFNDDTHILTGANIGLQMGDDLWSFQLVEETESQHSFNKQEIQGEAEAVFSAEPVETEISAEKRTVKVAADIDATPIEEILTEISPDEDVQELSPELQETEESAAEMLDIETYSLPVREQNTNTGTDANKSGSSLSNEQAESLLKSAASGESGDQSEFDSNAEDMEFEDFSFTDDFEQIQAESHTFEQAGNDNHDSSLNQIRGATAGTSAATSKITTRMTAGLSAMQARAEALANQDSFTLKGSDFGGDMDIRMRSTMKGLDLTLMPHLAAQANRLNGSLKTIKGMLNDRGIGTTNVRLNTDQVMDPLEEQYNRFQDTALFTEVAGQNDNRVTEILEVRETAQNQSKDNEGDLA